VEDLKGNYRKAVFIWLDMVFGIFICALVVEFMGRNSAHLKRLSFLQETDILRYMILLGFAIMTFFLIKYIHNQTLSTHPPEKHVAPKPKTVKLLVAEVASLSLCEAVAIYGLVLFCLTKNPADFYIFMVLSLIYFACFFPRYAQWEESIREVEGKQDLEVWALR
jgi:amino acid transporter